MFSRTTNAPLEPRTFRALARRAVDTVVSFALLEDVSGAPDPVDDARTSHPHAARLTPPTRDRRPGRPAPRAQHCITPLEGRARRQQDRRPTAA